MFITRIFSYMIIFQLIVSAVSPHYGEFISSAQAEGCPSGLAFNELLNQCLTTEQTAKAEQAKSVCITKATREEQKACFNEAVTTGLTDGDAKNHKGKNPGAMSGLPIVTALAGVVASLYFYMSGGGASCAAYSHHAMLAGGVMVILGEIMSSMQYKKKLKDSKADFDKILDKDSETGDKDEKEALATDAQVAAFQAMIKKEQAIKSAANTKKTFYTMATLLYAVSATLSAVELVQQAVSLGGSSGQFICKAAVNPIGPQLPTGQMSNPLLKMKALEGLSADTPLELVINLKEMDRYANGELTSLSLDDYSSIKNDFSYHSEMTKKDVAITDVTNILKSNLSLFPSANAGAGGMIGFLSLVAAVPAVASIGGLTGILPMAVGLKKLYLTSGSRLVLAGLLTVQSGIQVAHMNKEAKTSQQRIGILQGLSNGLVNSEGMFACTPEDRENISKPNCYCFVSDGGQNSARSNSDVCKAAFGSDPNLTTTPDGVSNNLVSTDKTCVSTGLQVDTSCSCKTNSSCLKLTSTFTGNASLAKAIAPITAKTNGVFGGALSASNLDTAALTANANALTALKDKLLNDPKNNIPKNEIANMQKQADAFMQSQQSQLGDRLASSGGGGSSFGSGSAPSLAGLSKADAIKAIKKDLAEERKALSSSGASNKNGLDGLDLGLGGGPQGGVVEDGSMAQAMNQEFDIGNSDINSDKSASIFDVLSNRYQRSGLRRLFGGEKAMEADTANKEQINQK